MAATVLMRALVSALVLNQFQFVRAQLQISMGYAETCSLWGSDYKCWGAQPGTTSPPNEPYDVGNDFQATKILSGQDHHCVISVKGQVRCWGQNGYGQLGIGNTTSLSYGTRLNDVDLGSDFIATDGGLGHYHSCFLSSNHTIKCFGRNGNVWIPSLRSRVISLM